MRHFSSKGEGRCQKRNGNGAKRRVASRGFTGDIRIDIGAYRDLHRHRRCHKFRQSYSGRLGFDTPALVEEAGATAVYREAMEAALAAMQGLPAPGAHYLLPFGARGRFLFKMDFAEAEYISRVRSGVKGHFSYRQVAWEMKLKMEDWTFSAPAALWFAVRNPPQCRDGTGLENGVVWVLRAPTEDFRLDTNKYQPFDNDSHAALIFRPKAISYRIVAQSAAFTVHRPVGKEFCPP